MPYQWTTPESETDPTELHLWPHQSLHPRGFVLFIGVTLVMFLFPLTAVLGTAVLWGLLPFFLIAVGGIWFAISRNRHAGRILEVLTLTEDHAHLTRHDPNGTQREWDCNRYWAKANMHESGGPVPHYVTLSGGGREVEIGAFLSEDERKSLHRELQNRLSRAT